MDAMQNAPTRFAQRPQAPRGSRWNEDGHEEGDISISLRMGTFLFRFDTSQPANLYYRQNKYTLGNISIGWEQIEP